MYNWNTDINQLKKNSVKFKIWKFEQLINFGLNGEKIDKKELLKYFHRLKLDKYRRKFICTGGKISLMCFSTRLTNFIMKISLNKSRAFTLIELLIVITIIGILAVALLPRITSGPEKARDAQRKADLQQISTALEFYADDHSGSYPSYTAGNCINATASSTLEAAIDDYLTSVPEDPQASSTNCYKIYGTSDGFLLVATLENDTATASGIYVASATSSISSSITTSANLDALSSKLCSTTSNSCSTNGSIYIVAR